jgi:HEAT repeat protein
MAKRTVEQILSDLHALRSDPASADVRAKLTDALSSRTNLVVAKAADVIRDVRLADLAPLLVPAFDRFINAPNTDKGCIATTAIAKTLYEFGHDAADVFLRGIRHVQKAWSGASDAATELRGVCAFGLVRMGYREMMPELINLLVDKEPEARAAACRALAYTGRDDAALLLRFKILIGDKDADVMAEAFTALVRLAPDHSLSFLEHFLDDAQEDFRNAAALAIGESRRPAAFDLLQKHYDRAGDSESRRMLLIAISLLRLPQSLEFLITLVSTAPASAVQTVLDALKTYGHDDQVRARIRAALTARDEPSLLRLYDDSQG